jgi:hypothetical protein
VQACWTRGVHGGSGQWLVNGSSDGLVELSIEPPCYTARSFSHLFVKAKVNALRLSLVDPDGFIAELAAHGVNSTSGQGDEETAKQWGVPSKRSRRLIGVAAVAEVGLLVAALIDIKRRPTSQIRGPKRLWAALAFLNFVGPITYFAFGRRQPRSQPD